jgi:integrase/recombinase XerD
MDSDGGIDAAVAAFGDALLAERGLSPRTAESYGRDLAAFAAFLAGRGKTRLRQIERVDITAFLEAERVRGLKGSSRARRAVAVRMWMRFLLERRRLAADPSALVETPRRGRVLPRVLTEAETAAMIDAVAGDDPRSLRDRALLEANHMELPLSLCGRG